MSSFVVSDECLDRAVSLWANPVGSFRRPLYSPDIDILKTRLLNLNLAAVEARYPGRDSQPTMDELVQHNGRAVDPIVALKSLQCLIYQCSEGDIPRNSLVYQEMRDVERATMGYLLSQLPEYKAAPWG